MFRLDGKTALITGATGGIGSEIAKSLHAAGATIIISGTREAKLEEMVKGFGERAFAEKCDLSNREEVESLLERASSYTGSVDILVANAGITKDNLSLRMNADDFEEVIDINLISSYILNKNAIKKMLKNRWGRIINISSVVAATGNIGQANYTASKAGLIAMSKSLAQEVAQRGITVNTVAPGFIKTPMTEDLPDEYKEQLIKKIPVGRYGTSEEIASGVLFLASEEARYITGQTLHINGGMFMN